MTDLIARLESADGPSRELFEAATALRDDMLERARWAALRRGDDDLVVEVGSGVWFRFNKALATLAGPGEGPEPRNWHISNNRLASAPHFTSEKPLTKRQRRRARKEPT